MAGVEETGVSFPENPQQPQTSLFPLFALDDDDDSLQHSVGDPQWLSNASFNTELSLINESVSSQPAHYTAAELVEGEDVDEEQGNVNEHSISEHFKLLESSPSDREQDSDASKHQKKERKKKKRKLMHSGKDSRARASDYGFSSRKRSVRSWASSNSKPTKEYYFDSGGDRDNLAFGCLYKMDVARYKIHNPSKLWGLNNHKWYRRVSFLDGDADMDVLDNKLKSGGRYWSAKYAALEHHKNLKRFRIIVPKKSAVVIPDGDFIPFSDLGTSGEGDDGRSFGGISVVEESWEDEVLRKTREFNKLSRERPQDEKVWLSFAEFQDKVASMQPQKGARLQTLEKKISILEKATELNPDNEEIWLGLLKAYQNRDSSDVLFGRWEKILVQHSGSYKLWKEFLHVFQNEFSRFKVSDMRKMYANAIQALVDACTKQRRQSHSTGEPRPLDPDFVQLELGLVDLFVSLCRFEWQAGYQELATALFQAEIEYSLFCPSLLLSEQSKQRLFEYFWNGNGARIGEDGALGWSRWLEKEEENRQRIIREESSRETDKGGWTGWSEPLCRNKEATVDDPINIANNEEDVERAEEQYETDDVNLEDDTETLLKMLGIDANAEAVGDVQDATTWTRWSEEESRRDGEQWMPLLAKSDVVSSGDGTADGEADEQLMRVILYEDVCEYLFSLSLGEARFCLVSQFIDFFGGKISQFCTNSLSWNEKILSSEVIPDCILEDLRRVHDVLIRAESTPSSSSLESLLADSTAVSRSTNTFKFLRNATLLCLTVFPRNHVLEEAALVAEELSNTRMDANSCSVTPCRALAKCLLKNDRQNILLCGVYAQREAAFGNIDHARKVFDMALLSVEGLPLDLRSNVPLLYFWYAELELTVGSDNSQDTLSRAIHILSTLGSNTSYSPYKSQPSSMQLLRARQGFIDRIRTLRPAWARGIIDDHSVAFICSAALFEELTSGFPAAVDVLTQALSMVLPETRSQSYQLEFLFNYYVKMLCRHHKQSKLSKVWGSITSGLQMYPFSSKLFHALVEIGHLYTTPVKLRRMFDYYYHQKKLSAIVCLFALSFEICRGNSQHRIRGLFEKALADEKLCSSVLLWRCFVAYEANVARDPSAARRIFFRAIHACPWSKKLWLDGFLKLNSILSVKEMSDLQEVMRDKELNLRTDVYEILLQDEIK